MIRAAELFSHMGLDPDLTNGGGQDVRTPIDGSVIGSVMYDDPVAWEESIGLALRAYEHWRDVPAPQRGDLVRRYGEVLRVPQGRTSAGWSAWRRARSSARAWARSRR